MLRWHPGGNGRETETYRKRFRLPGFSPGCGHRTIDLSLWIEHTQRSLLRVLFGDGKLYSLHGLPVCFENNNDLAMLAKTFAGETGTRPEEHVLRRRLVRDETLNTARAQEKPDPPEAVIGGSGLLPEKFRRNPVRISKQLCLEQDIA